MNNECFRCGKRYSNKYTLKTHLLSNKTKCFPIYLNIDTEELYKNMDKYVDEYNKIMC